jgi:putative glutamine amidotransferase
MKLVAVSQRVDVLAERREHRDALDQNLVSFLLKCGFIAVPVPNAIMNNSEANVSRQYFDTFISKIKPRAFILSGGQNIGENILRDQTELEIINYAEKNKLPMIGICRGMQMMAHRAGGINIVPLTAHAGTHHEIRGEIFGKVNSYHDYGISDCPNNYKVIARSNDNSIEAIKHCELPWEGWMWHPEREPNFNNRDLERMRNVFDT